MLKRLKTTFKHTAIYSLGNISNKIVGLILLPIYTNTSILTTDDFGRLVLLEILSQILVAVFALELGRSLLRWCAQEKNIDVQNSIIFTSFSFALFVVIVFNFVLSFFSNNLSLLLFESEKYANYFFLVFIWSGLLIINQIPMSVLRFYEKSIKYATLSVVNFTASLLFIIYFVVVQKKGVEGVLLGQIFGNSVLFFLTLSVIIKNSKFSFRIRTLKDMLLFGFPLIFSSLSSLLLIFGDRYILEYYLPLAIVGIYSLGYKLASTVNVFIIQSFQLGYTPIAYKMINEPNAKRFYSKMLTYFVLALTFLSLIIAFISKEVLNAISSSDYSQSYTVVPIILLAFIFRGINYMFSLGFHIAKKTKQNAIIIVTTAILSIILNFILVPLIGMYGSAVSMLISFFIMSTWTYYSANSIYKIPYEIKKTFVIIFVGVLLYLPTYAIEGFPIILQLFIKLVMMLLFPVILYYLNVFEKVEIDKVKTGVKKITARL